MEDECTFCDHYDFSVVINKALYSKYSASQNYSYIKLINDLVFARRSRATTVFKDYLYYDYCEEYLTKYTQTSMPKIQELAEYYRFQNAVPRLFNEPAAQALLKYHNNKRKLQYNRLTRPFQQLKSFSCSKILKSSMISVAEPQCQLLHNNSTSGSIFFIKNQLSDIVSNSFKDPQIAVQLRKIYDKFTARQNECKKTRKQSRVQSIDRETQTSGIAYMKPIIKTKDKLFLQQIVKQQKLIEYSSREMSSAKKYNNKVGSAQKSQRTRNSVEFYTSRYHSAQKPNVGTNNQSTAKIYSSQLTSARLSSTFKQSRTKSQSYDSNGLYRQCNSISSSSTMAKLLENKITRLNQQDNTKLRKAIK